MAPADNVAAPNGSAASSISKSDSWCIRGLGRAAPTQKNVPGVSFARKEKSSASVMGSMGSTSSSPTRSMTAARTHVVTRSSLMTGRIPVSTSIVTLAPDSSRTPNASSNRRLRRSRVSSEKKRMVPSIATRSARTLVAVPPEICPKEMSPSSTGERSLGAESWAATTPRAANTSASTPASGIPA